MAAVDHQLGTRDVRSCFRTEQQECTVKLIGAAKPALWNAPDQGFAGISQKKFGIEICLDISRTERVHPNAMTRKL
jgi:hypothetical protein